MLKCVWCAVWYLWHIQRTSGIDFQKYMDCTYRATWKEYIESCKSSACWAASVEQVADTISSCATILSHQPPSWFIGLLIVKGSSKPFVACKNSKNALILFWYCVLCDLQQNKDFFLVSGQKYKSCSQSSICKTDWGQQRELSGTSEARERSYQARQQTTCAGEKVQSKICSRLQKVASKLGS